MSAVDNPQIVAAIHGAAFVAFFLLLFVGAVSTVARIVYYRVNGVARPRLLSRDAVVIGGFAISFGLILVVRLLGIGPTLRDNVVWALATDVPAICSVLVYTAFELFVIERRDPK